MLNATPIGDVREAAALAGAQSFDVATDGNPRVSFRNGWGAAHFLLELARKDAKRAWIKGMAAEMRRRAGGGDLNFAMGLQSYGQSLPFFHEEGEIFQGPALTTRRGGDCDCHARLIYALAKAGGLPTELAFMHKGANPTHVFARVYADGAWRPLETTVSARFAEDPFSAARRLGVVREDMASPEIITMGEMDNGDCPEDQDAGAGVELGADGEAPDDMGAITRPEITHETSQLDDAYFAAIVRDAKEDGGTPEMRNAILLSESGLQPRRVNSIGCVGLNQFCPGTLEGFWKGTADEYRQLPASEQIKMIRRFWQGHAAHHGPSVWDGSGRNLYWINFLPDSYAAGVDDDWLIAAGVRSGSDKDASSWDGSHDFYVAGTKSNVAKPGLKIPYRGLLKANPSFVTVEGNQRVIRASALSHAIAGNIKANPKMWAELNARINFARKGGGGSGAGAAIVAMLVLAGGVFAAAKYL